MAYQEYAITSLSEIPNLFTQFAQGLGWQVSYSPEYRFRIPDDPTAVNWRIYANESDAQHKYLFIDAPDESEQMRGGIRSPRLAPMPSGGVYTPSTPTKLHMLGGFDGAPWLVAIIEYGFNSYRHLYVGYMEKIGDYTGGEVVCGCDFLPYYVSSSQSATRSPYHYSYDYMHKYLFSWYNNMPSDWAGGVRINHPDNPNAYRTFRSGNVSYVGWGNTPYPVTGVIGGFRDGVNDGYLARANVSYAGSVILVPINLYVGAEGNWLIPIGRPAGVRMVNMRNIEPGASITIANDTWRCFPMFRKTDYSNGPPLVISNNWRVIAEESSYVIGYAYLENKEDDSEGDNDEE